LTFSKPLNANYIAGYTTIKNYNGQSAFNLGVTIPRTSYVQGLITLNYIDELVLVSCVVFSVIIFISLEFLVLSKLSKLTGEVTKITQHSDLSERLPTKGNDEFETLTKSINKMLEEIEENNKKLRTAQRFSAIGELATMIAHDLRNPLQGISNAAFYLKKKTKHEKSEIEKEMIKQIEDDVRYSDKIVNDLLDYSKEYRLDLQAVSPQALLRESISIYSVPDKIELVDKTSDQPLVHVDLESMKRVLINLIANAVDAMPEGGKLTVDCQVRERLACLIIADTGEGMTDDVKQKIFQPLFTTKAKGMGFGLSICRRIVETHRGRLEVESSVGKGSVFYIYLPIAASKSSDK
jgi:signal transduction histidine kinase